MIKQFHLIQRLDINGGLSTLAGYLMLNLVYIYIYIYIYISEYFVGNIILNSARSHLFLQS